MQIPKLLRRQNATSENLEETERRSGLFRHTLTTACTVICRHNTGFLKHIIHA